MAAKGEAASSLVLVILAPLLAEVLPGATRFSSLFVFPIEVCVWGGGALLIRFAVRRLRLGWPHMLLLALALSLAEECLIQQTSLAPLVVKLRGAEYARALGVNYVYLLWALLYESAFVVLLPVQLAELIFPDRRESPWLGRRSAVLVALAFALGARLAWYTWTQIARPKVFHLAAYAPPPQAQLLSLLAIAALLLAALGPWRAALAWRPRPRDPPARWVLSALGAAWAALLFGLVLLAFGAWPTLLPLVAVAVAGLLAASALLFVPRWIESPRWQAEERFSLIFGCMLGSMLPTFAGFIDALPRDLYFKVLVDVIAVALMVRLGRGLRGRSAAAASDVGLD